MFFFDTFTEIPFEEAAAYLTGLKKLAQEDAIAQEMVSEEFAVPIEEILQVMGELVKGEFETHYAYKVYAQTLRDLSRGVIAAHFEEHADDEMEHAEYLLKRMAVLGGPVHVPDIPAPPPSTDPKDILQKLIQLETQSITRWKLFLRMLGDHPMVSTIEQYIADEQEHLDDLWQLLPHSFRTPVLDESMKTAKELTPEQHQALIELARRETMGMLREDGYQKAQRAIGSSLAKAESQRNAALGRQVGGILGATSGGAAAGIAAHHLAKNPLATVVASGGGAFIGRGLGKDLGNYVGQLRDMKNTRASMKEALDGQIMKKAEEFPSAEEYLAQERMLSKQEQESVIDFYRQRFMNAQQQLQQVQAQSMQMQQQMQQLQQQVEQSDEQLQQIMMQAQQMQQQALQQNVEANSAASEAMQHAMMSNQELLAQKRMASNMRNAYQQLQQQLQQVVDEPPPPAITEEVGQQAPEPYPEMSAEQQAQEHMMQEQMAQEQGQAPPEQMPQEQMPPEQEMPPEAMGQEGAPAQEQATEEQMPKTSSQAQTESLAKILKTYYPEILGATLTGAAAGANSYVDTKYADRGKMEDTVKALEAVHDNPEVSGWKKVKNLAKLEAARTNLKRHDLSQEHPHAVALSTALAGATLGAAFGRQIKNYRALRAGKKAVEIANDATKPAT